MLSIALGAFYLTKDEAPWEAVYDTLADKERLLNWLAPVRGGNTADELSKVGFAAILLPAITFQAIGQIYRTVQRRAPLALIPIGALIAYGAYKVPGDRYKDVWRGLGYAPKCFLSFGRGTKTHWSVFPRWHHQFRRGKSLPTPHHVVPCCSAPAS